MTHDELAPMEGQKVALTAQVDGDSTQIAYHGVLLKITEKAVILGLGNIFLPKPVLIQHVTRCIPFADQSQVENRRRNT